MTILPLLVTPIAGLTASNRDACPGPLTSPSSSQSAAPHRSLRTPFLPPTPSLVLLLLLLLPAAALSQSVTTQQYTNARIGIQSQETLLTPSNVSVSSFGKLFSLPVAGHVYAQPLYVPALTLPDNTVHNVLFVATEQDCVYAFDADGHNPEQGYLWRVSLLGANETWVSYQDVNVGDIYPDIGITGTPVIAPSTLTLYVVAKSKIQSGTPQFFQRLHALSLLDGSEKLNGPTLIQASAPGTGDGGTTISFNPLLNNQRAGLLLAATPHGPSHFSVFISWASHGDLGHYHGWVISYNASNITQQTGVWSDSPNGSQGGIWLAGGALSSDDQGNIFLAAGNGTFDANTGGSDYGDSAVSLSLTGSTLAPSSYFTPADQSVLAAADTDMGISSNLILPTQSGPIPHLTLTADKSGTLYLLNRDNLGGYTPTNDTSVQTFYIGNTLRTSMTFFNNTLYLAGEGGPLTAWPLNPSTEQFPAAPSTSTTLSFGCSDCGGGGSTPVISANGTSNAILWALDTSARENGPAILHAYDPSNLQSEFYNSSQAPNNRDTAAVAIKFSAPVVANGHVYVAGVNAVTAYGQLTSYPTVAINPTPATIPSGSSSTLNVTTTATTQLTLSGSDGTTYTLPPAGGTQTVSPTVTTTYTATAVGTTKVSNATTVTVTSPGGCIPSTPGALICAPTPQATPSSPVTITAGATASSGYLAALRVYIDNVAALTVNNPSATKSFQFSQALPATPGAHYLVLVGYMTTGGTILASENFTVASAAATTPLCMPAAAGALICSPSPTASTTSPLTLTAAATAGSGNLAAIRAYIDNVPALTVNNPSATKSFVISQPVTAAPGTHSLVIVGYQSTGGAVLASENFTVAGTSTTCLPSSPGAIFCSPGSNATVSSPVTIFAGATAASGSLAAIRIYVDNVAQTLINNPQATPSLTINQPLTLPSGTHYVVLVGYPSTGGSVSAAETITIQ